MAANPTKMMARTSLMLGFLLLTQAAHSHSHVAMGQDTFYPQGKKLLFSMYSLVEPQLSSAATEGLTAIGPYYGNSGHEKALAYSQAAKLPVFYTAGTRLDFETETGIVLEDELELLRRDIAAASERPEIAAWALANEELRYWRPAEMKWLEQATKVIRDNDPYDRPILMYEPNNRTADAMTKTSKYLDFVARGTYANYANKKYTRTWVRWSIEQAVAAAAATDTTPLAVLWMARDQDNEADIASIPLWTRHDVYLSLITGAKGILVFSGRNNRSGFKKHFQNFYDGYIATAKELNGAPNLGSVFLRGEKTESVSLSIIYGPAVQSFEIKEQAHEYPTVSSAEYALGGRNYLFVVNSAESEVTLKLDGLPQDKEISDAFTGEKAAVTKTMKLDRLEVIALTW
jgi:hypothetical protein